MYKYYGPSQALQLEENGQIYRPGDSVPIPKEIAEHMAKVENGGHRFEGIEVPEVRGALPADLQFPTDNRGQLVDPDNELGEALEEQAQGAEKKSSKR